MISDYVERLARELAFDPSLAQSVRREVEDHLWEAVAADPIGNGREAEERAIARFGDPHAIAAQFAIVSLGKQARRVSGIALLVIVAAFVAMKARLTWYAVTQWPVPDGMESFGAIVASIDRYAFWLSVVAGIAAWMYIGSRDVPAAFTREFRGELRRFSRLSAVATGALIASVLGDGVLTSLRLAGAPSHFEALIPVGSMVIEAAGAVALIARIYSMIQRAAWIGRTARES